MWRLIAVLAAITYVTHNVYLQIASLWPDQQRAAEEIFYVARGIEGLFLFGAILFVTTTGTRASIAQTCALIALCIYGAAHETLTSICGAAYMHMTGVGKHANDRSKELCDAATGYSDYLITVCLTIISIVFIKHLWGLRRARRDND